MATTFVNKSCDQSVLLDLKYLLLEAKQRIPPLLAMLDDPTERQGPGSQQQGCAFCGGLGHRVITCPKLEQQRMKLLMGGGDELSSFDARNMGGAATDW